MKFSLDLLVIWPLERAEERISVITVLDLLHRWDYLQLFEKFPYDVWSIVHGGKFDKTGYGQCAAFDELTK